jgi:hypothetical protein
MATSTRTRTRRTPDDGVTVTMTLDKETTRTIRYKEDTENPRIGVIYIPKATLAELGDPQEITVTISA